MRRAFTLIELMIVIAIIAIIAAIAIPNLLEARRRGTPLASVAEGDTVRLKVSGLSATVLRRGFIGVQRTFVCRVDNGANAPLRFTEVTFFEGELELPATDVERAPR